MIIDTNAIGVEVSWSFGSGDSEAVTLDRSRVIELFLDHGFDVERDLRMVPNAAIRRAARYVRQTQDVVVREFKHPNKDTPSSYGVYKRAEGVGEAGDGWQCHARVRVQGDAIVSVPPEGEPTYPLDSEVVELADDMARMANKVLTEVMNVDLSKALTNVGKGWGWISRRRNSGGVYFIPSGDFAESYIRVLQALRVDTEGRPRCEQFIPQIQETYPRPLTLESWGGSSADAFAADLEAMRVSLDDMFRKGAAADRVIERRAAACEALILKADRFKSILVDLPAVVEAAEKIKSAYQAALQKGITAAAQEFARFDRVAATGRRETTEAF